MRDLQLEFVCNPVTARWLRILNSIERVESFTIVKLSEEMKVTQRTLITDISFLKKHFANSASFVYANNRYEFREADRLLYQDLKQQLLKDEILFDIMSNIFYGELDTVVELSDYLNYSESTVRRLLLVAQEALKQYELSLSYNPINIVGEEKNIRRFFFDFYYEGEETTHTLHPPSSLFNDISENISNNIDDYELGTGCTISAFYYILYITMERNRRGYKVSMPNELNEVIFREKDFKTLCRFQSLIESKYGVFLSKDEFSWVHFQLLTRRPLDQAYLENIFYNRFNLWPQIDEVAKKFLSSKRIEKSQKEILIPFIKSFFLSRKLNDYISPVSNKLLSEEIVSVETNSIEELKKNYLFLTKYNPTLALSENFLYDVAVCLTLYSQILFRYHAPSLNILFLIEGDYLVVQYIRTQAKLLLGSKHNVKFVKIFELSEKMFLKPNIDLLITNYSVYVSDFNLTKDYILLKQVPDRKDWRRILDKINYLAENPL